MRQQFPALHRCIPVLLALGAAVLTSPVAPAQQVHAAEVAAAAAPSAAQITAGEQVFKGLCMACHQADGKGLPGAFPPLAGSDFLLGNSDRAVGIVVNGLQGEVVINGAKYNAVMPAMTQLTDQQIADAITYVLNSWGNSGGSITVTRVAAERALAARTTKKADSPTQHATTASELKYQGAPSPVGAAGAQIRVTPARPT